MIFSSFIPTLIKDYLKIKYLNKWFFSSKEVGCKNFFLVKSLLFIGAGAGAGQKRTGSATLCVDVLTISYVMCKGPGGGLVCPLRPRYSQEKGYNKYNYSITTTLIDCRGSLPSWVECLKNDFVILSSGQEQFCPKKFCPFLKSKIKLNIFSLQNFTFGDCWSIRKIFAKFQKNLDF